MTEQEKRARFFEKTGRVATSSRGEYQAFLWGMEIGTESEREACAKVCDAHTVDDVLVGVGIAKSCATMIRMRSNVEITGAGTASG